MFIAINTFIYNELERHSNIKRPRLSDSKSNHQKYAVFDIGNARWMRVCLFLDPEKQHLPQIANSFNVYVYTETHNT